MTSLNSKDLNLLVGIQRKLDRVSTCGTPKTIFEALRAITPVAGGLICDFSAANMEASVSHVVGLNDRILGGWVGSSPEQFGAMVTPLVVARAGDLISDTKALQGPTRNEIDLLRTMAAEGFGEAAGYKVCEIHGRSRRFTFMTLALEGPLQFTHRDHVILAMLRKYIHNALERLRIPLIPSEKIQMQIMEERNQGYMLISQARLDRCVETNLRARTLVERYAASVGIQADRQSITAFGLRAIQQCNLRNPWVISRLQGDADLEIRVHALAKEEHAIGEDLWLVTMEETIHPRDPIPFDGYGFTPRELEIVELLMNSEYTVKDMAEELGTSPHTVRTQIQNIRRKVGVSSRAGISAKLNRRRHH